MIIIAQFLILTSILSIIFTEILGERSKSRGCRTDRLPLPLNVDIYTSYISF